MSDEQMDEWLERPVDAEVHRYRKLSEVSSSWLDGLTDEEDLKIHVIKEQPDEEDYAALWQRPRASSIYPEDWTTVEETASEDDTTPTENAPATESKLLSLPDDLLQNIAFHVQPENARPFRLSCMKLYDLVQETAP